MGYTMYFNLPIYCFKPWIFMNFRLIHSLSADIFMFLPLYRTCLSSNDAKTKVICLVLLYYTSCKWVVKQVVRNGSKLCSKFIISIRVTKIFLREMLQITKDLLLVDYLFSQEISMRIETLICENSVLMTRVKIVKKDEIICDDCVSGLP